MRYVLGVTPYNLVLVFLLAGALSLLFLGRRKAGQRAFRQSPPRAVIRRASGARYLGLESDGTATVRGPGALILAADGLHFQTRSERRELFIPAASIVYLGGARTFKAQSLSREILVVHYLNLQGRPEAAGFEVSSPGRWVAAFKDALAARNPGPSRKPHGNHP